MPTTTVVVGAIPFCHLEVGAWQTQSLPELVSYVQYFPLLLQVALWLYSFGRKELVLLFFALYMTTMSLLVYCMQEVVRGERPRPECTAPWMARYAMPAQEFFYVYSIATFMAAYCCMWTWLPSLTVWLSITALTVLYTVFALLLGLCDWQQALVGALMGVSLTALFMLYVRTYLASRVEFLMGALRPWGYEDHWLCWALTPMREATGKTPP